MPTARILIVDDEKNVRVSLASILDGEGFHCDLIASGEECLERMRQKLFDLVILDVWLPGCDGLATLEKIRTAHLDTQVVMISGHASIETAVRATKLGAFDFLEKPLSLEKTLVVVKNALKQRQLERENRLLRDQVVKELVMIGESVPMQALRQQIEFAAPTNGRVLIYGENGSGKELVARTLHARSLRRDRSLVEVNCAAIPDDLIESELFGYVKGAFTGATESRVGKFQLADQGTLFLDEVGDMSLKTQSKVLRVLEEQRFHPLGSNDALEVDVRVLAATNKNLELEIEKGAFREDLFYRLNVIPFQVPPLRDRREDIPLLVDHFLHEFARHYGKGPKTLGTSILERFMQYSWPGNIRELKNTIERLMIMVPGDEVHQYHLPRAIVEQEGSLAGANGQESLKDARDTFERNYILKKLAEFDGNVAKVAEALNVERSNLYKKIKAYGIE